jgi:hypothetical protein
MGSADLHGFAAGGVASNVHNDPFRVTILKEIYDDWYLKKRVFLCRFQKSTTFLGDKMAPKR